MKGILLVGGAGTRLYPMTKLFSKQLLPLYDKPMVYYPLTTLLWAGVREILVISTPEDQVYFQRLLGDGSWLGVKFQYVVQPKPAGIAQALILAKDFLAGSSSVLALGDNVFYGSGLPETLAKTAKALDVGATVFGYWVRDPERYGVVAFDEKGVPKDLVEKPSVPPSSWAVTGLYLYDGTAPERAARLKPSARGELEITDLNLSYLREGSLKVEKLGRGIAWLDTGTPEALLKAGIFLQAVEERQGLKVCCPEEVAWRMGLIDDATLSRQADALGKSSYGLYLRSLMENEG